MPANRPGYAHGVCRAPILILLLWATACGGTSTTTHSRELYMQRCASCHGIAADAAAPVADAPNILAGGYDVETVRRAVIDGRPGMPKGLLGGHDVDEIAAYIAGRGGG
jgi:cytochrome c551